MGPCCMTKQAKDAKAAASLAEQNKNQMGPKQGNQQQEGFQGYQQPTQQLQQRPTANSVNQAPFQLLDPIGFKEVPIQNIRSQEEFENYFVLAVALKREDIVEKMLDFNYVEGRNTVVSLSNMNSATQQQQPYIDNVTHLNLSRAGQQGLLRLKTLTKVYPNVSAWNPCLLMIALNQQKSLEKLILTRVSEYLHLNSCFNKNYPLKRQCQIAFSQEKRMKVESYALKLCVYNQNEKMLKFLLNGKPIEFKSHTVSTAMNQLSQIWNLGHIMEAIKYMITTKWVQGIHFLFSLRRVKQIFGSVNDAISFMELIQAMLKQIHSLEIPEERQILIHMLMNCLDQDPYFLLRTCLSMFVQGKYMNNLEKVLMKTINRASAPFFEREIESIFSMFDPDGVFLDHQEAIKTKLQTEELTDTKARKKYYRLVMEANQFVIMSQQLQGNQGFDQVKNDNFMTLIEEIDPFGFKVGVSENERETYSMQENIVQIILKSGNEQIIEFFYSADSDCNIKPLITQSSLERQTNMLIENNRFEVTDQIPFIDVSFFKSLIQHDQPNRFFFVFQLLIDSMKLRNVFDLASIIAKDDIIGNTNQLEMLSYILNNKKFSSLFQGSLEMQKYIFVLQLAESLSDEEIFNQQYMAKNDLQKLKGLLKNNPLINYYYEQIQKGEEGKQYLRPTQEFLARQQQTQSQRGIIKYKYVISEDMDPLYPEQDGNDSNILKSDEIREQLSARKQNSNPKRKISVIQEEPLQRQAQETQKLGGNNLKSQKSQNSRFMERESEISKATSQKEEQRNSHGFDMGALIRKEAEKKGGGFAFDKDKEQNGQAVQPRNTTEEDEFDEDSFDKIKSEESILLKKKGTDLSSPPPEVKQNQNLSQALFIDEDDIHLQFDKLTQYKIYSEISIAYHEIISNIKSGELVIADLNLILEEYKLNPFDPIQVNGIESQDAENEDLENEDLMKDKALWNVLLFAIYFDKTDIVSELLSNDQFLDLLDPMAILKPPTTNQEFHITEKKNLKSPKRNIFAFELAINNKNEEVLMLLLDTFAQSLNCNDLCQLSLTLVGEEEDSFNNCEWLEGIQSLLLSNFAKILFEHLRPEDKEMFIATSLIEPILQASKNQQMVQKNSVKANSFLKTVIKELRQAPYVKYSVLRYPQLFSKFGVLDKSICLVTDDDIVVYLSASDDNMHRLINYNNSLEQKKGQSIQAIKDIIQIAQKKVLNQQKIVPNSPLPMIQFIINNDPRGFQSYFKQGGKIPLLFKYFGYQLTAGQQTHLLEYLPQDEIIQSLLYDTSGFNRADGDSQDSANNHLELVKLLNNKTILTDAWNPLIFAIYFGNIGIVKFLLSKTDTQQLSYLLSDPFLAKMEDDESHSDDAPVGNDGNDNQFYKERTELLPLILCLVTKNSAMFELLWNQQFLWNKDIYLIILGNFVFESNNTEMIRAFLLAEKTQRIFKHISLAEQQKFIQFTIKSLEHQIVADESEKGDSDNEDDDDQEEKRLELERILNMEMLCRAPYSLINLTENLLPLNIHSTASNLAQLFEQYRQSPESLQLLEMTLKNLQGDSETEAFKDKWILINSNQIWAKKLYSLIEELIDDDPNIVDEFKCIHQLQEDLFREFITGNGANYYDDE